MAKVKIYDPKKEKIKEDAKEKMYIIIEVFLDLFIYALVLIFASLIFKGFYVENFVYAFFAAAVLSFLNVTLKPLLSYLMLPVTLLSLGILYPIVNIVIIKICALLLTPHFIVEGFIAPFFLVVFISALKMILDALILNKIKEV